MAEGGWWRLEAGGWRLWAVGCGLWAVDKNSVGKMQCSVTSFLVGVHADAIVVTLSSRACNLERKL